MPDTELTVSRPLNVGIRLDGRVFTAGANLTLSSQVY